MQNNPLLALVVISVGAYVTKLWFEDTKSAVAGSPNPRALPGATPVARRALWIAAFGGLAIVAGETAGEYALGVSGEQSNMTALFAIYTLVAAFIEEIIFRGYLVVNNRGAALRWASVFVFSALFAALHPFLWEWKESTLVWQFTTKAWFSTAAVFLGSLWFYFVRFASFNPSQSLAPCFAAHLAKNVGVIVIKGVQGHLVGLY